MNTRLDFLPRTPNFQQNISNSYTCLYYNFSISSNCALKEFRKHKSKVSVIEVVDVTVEPFINENVKTVI